MKRHLFAAAMLVIAVSGTAGRSGAAAAQRSEIEERYKWKLEDIYATDQAWEADFKRAQALVPKVAAFKGTLGKSGASLLAALKAQDEINDVTQSLFVYSGMRRDEDNRVSTYQGQVDRATTLNARVGEATAFFTPELLSIPPAKLATLLNSTPALAVYRHHLADVQRQRAHTLSEREEKLLAAAGEFSDATQGVFTAFNNADLRYGTIRDEQGKEIELTKAVYQRSLESSDRRVRREVFNGLHGAYGRFNNTLGATMNGNVKKDEFYARARKYGSAAEAALGPNNIPMSVYRNLVTTANAHLESLHRYASLRKKWLNLDTLHVYDLYVPLVTQAKFEVSFEQARDNVLAGLKPMGDEYLEVFRKGVSGGWIDVYETEGKTSGAYNWGTYHSHPFVLMNWTNTLDDEFTLAHEMGHALHSYFTHMNQPLVYGDYATFVAEVASTTNEAVLVNYLLGQEMTKTQRMYLLNHLLEQIRTTFFRQTLFAEFELRTHEMAEKGEPLTAEAMNHVYHDLYQKYYGPDLYVDPAADFEWSRIPHFYNSFYVYQYATSYAAATALSKKIMSEGQPAVTKYLAFLKSGSSDYPIEVLKRAGVDMNTPAPIEAACARFGEVLDQLEKLHDSP